VKVALSGDGGDEAFAGYPKHWLKSWQHHVSGFFPSGWRERLTLDSMKGGLWQQTKIMEKLRRRLLPETRSLFSGEFFSGRFFQSIATPMLQRRTASFLGGLVHEFWSGKLNAFDRILHWDNTEPLPYSLLTKLDIASMARSLEVRSPFLDHEFVELCAKLPRRWKVNGKKGKRILRDLVAPDLPPEVLDAPKRGFSVPLGQWWRNEARQQIRDGLFPIHSALQPFIEEKAAAHLLNQHQAGRANHAQRLWNLWVLNEWARTFLRN
jgi:asparagine synthase (glutamine-hydrolysing)